MACRRLGLDGYVNEPQTVTLPSTWGSVGEYRRQDIRMVFLRNITGSLAGEEVDAWLYAHYWRISGSIRCRHHRNRQNFPNSLYKWHSAHYLAAVTIRSWNRFRHQSRSAENNGFTVQNAHPPQIWTQSKSKTRRFKRKGPQPPEKWSRRKHTENFYQ